MVQGLCLLRLEKRAAQLKLGRLPLRMRPFVALHAVKQRGKCSKREPHAEQMSKRLFGDKGDTAQCCLPYITVTALSRCQVPMTSALLRAVPSEKQLNYTKPGALHRKIKGPECCHPIPKLSLQCVIAIKAQQSEQLLSCIHVNTHEED